MSAISIHVKNVNDAEVVLQRHLFGINVNSTQEALHTHTHTHHRCNKMNSGFVQEMTASKNSVECIMPEHEAFSHTTTLTINLKPLLISINKHHSPILYRTSIPRIRVRICLTQFFILQAWAMLMVKSVWGVLCICQVHLWDACTKLFSLAFFSLAWLGFAK